MALWTNISKRKGLFTSGWTPLHEAVQRNKYDMTESLLEAGAEVNCRGDNGITPLHDAIQCQYYKVCKLHTMVLRCTFNEH